MKRARGTPRSGSPYVTRGGRKLAFALGRFSVPVRGCVAADLGCHKGGFTDVLLRHVSGTDEEHAQLFVCLGARPGADDLGLLFGQFARPRQNTRQMAVAVACARVNQLSFAEVEGGHTRGHLDRESTSLPSKVDQVQELGCAKVPQVSF